MKSMLGISPGISVPGFKAWKIKVVIPGSWGQSKVGHQVPGGGKYHDNIHICFIIIYRRPRSFSLPDMLFRMSRSRLMISSLAPYSSSCKSTLVDIHCGCNAYKYIMNDSMVDQKPSSQIWKPTQGRRQLFQHWSHPALKGSGTFCKS